MRAYLKVKIKSKYQIIITLFKASWFEYVRLPICCTNGLGSCDMRINEVCSSWKVVRREFLGWTRIQCLVKKGGKNEAWEVLMRRKKERRASQRLLSSFQDFRAGWMCVMTRKERDEKKLQLSSCFSANENRYG